ncbi:hypothetical protein IEQ34_003944 [Dendrobium chrysotoxum]|uniref:Single-stranded DNA-binding protein, mitochondrial n=1 Tax=Dendrobium chrysotoxum TaxID=161865 RepID=A0AAV7HCQ7_DENCH|nr:hypothetical protein IEQ34_003944 [Dendrobium chrysotoxum]
MAFTSIYRNLLRRSIIPRPLFPSSRFFNTPLAGSESDHEGDEPFDTSTAASSGGPTTEERRAPLFRPLENGLDPGVYKAILVGKVGQKPVQKQLKSSRVVVLFSVATGGIRNNRRPLEDEEPRQYAERCAVQWHRVCIYPERLGRIALNHVKPGSLLYLEGNLETKVFSDPITGLVRRIREVAIRHGGRLVFLGNNGESGQPESADLRRAGYY